jgi:hypothetical protein
VRVTIEDCTGAIRASGAHEQTGAVAWTVSNEPGSTVSKTLTRPARIGSWIRMRVDSSGHSVLGITPDEPRRARALGGVDDSGFNYALFDAGGAMLATGKVADPRVVRGPMGSPGTPGLGHAIRTLPGGYYLIGIPEGADARKLRIRKREASIEKAAPAAGSGEMESTEQWLDL